MGVGNTQSWTPTIVMTPITGLLNWQHKHTIWCTDKTCSSGIWAPRSPHAMLHLPPVLFVLQILQRITALCFGQHIGWLVKMRGGTLRNHPPWENQLALWVPTTSKRGSATYTTRRCSLRAWAFMVPSNLPKLHETSQAKSKNYWRFENPYSSVNWRLNHQNNK